MSHSVGGLLRRDANMRRLGIAIMALVASCGIAISSDGVLLTWNLPAYGTPQCPQPTYLYLHEAYLGPGTGLPWYYDGVRLLPITTTELLLSPGKPEVGCAIEWGGGPDQGDFIPIAIDAGWVPLPPECQPFNFLVDGMTWEGL